MNNRPNYFSITPAFVRYDTDLSANAKLLYGEITALANTKGYCYATNSYFAELYHTTKETVSRWISQLKAKGFIKIIYEVLESTKEKVRKISINLEFNNQDLESKQDSHNESLESSEDAETENIEVSQAQVSKIDISNADFGNGTDFSVEVLSSLTFENNSVEPLIFLSRGIDENVKGGIDENVNHNNTRSNKYLIIDNIYNFFEQKFSKPITEYTKSFLNFCLQYFSEEMVRRAIEIAAENNVKKISYVFGILKNWKKKGYKSLNNLNQEKQMRNTIPDFTEEQLAELEDILNYEWFEEGSDYYAGT